MSEFCNSTTKGRSQNDWASEWRTLSLKPEGMAGRGDCCAAPYEANNSYDQIMLRFRSIAPKPAPSTAAGGSSLGGLSPDSKKGSRARHTRGGRSNITASEKKKKKKRNIARCLSSRTPQEEMDRVTLPLLPPRPQDDHKGNYCSRVVCIDVTDDTKEGKPNFMQSGDVNYDLDPGFGFPMTKLTCKGSLVQGGDGAFVVVDAWVEGDEGRVISLRDEACPCFISDGEGRLRWLNEAFRRMVATTGGDGGGVAEQREEEVGWDGTVRSFACRVRMVCTWLGMKMGSMTSPCDVWRLDGGDFAWRLDVGAALRLAP